MSLIPLGDLERRVSLRGCRVDLEVRLCVTNISKENIYNGSFNTEGCFVNVHTYKPVKPITHAMEYIHNMRTVESNVVL